MNKGKRDQNANTNQKHVKLLELPSLELRLGKSRLFYENRLLRHSSSLRGLNSVQIISKFFIIVLHRVEKAGIGETPDRMGEVYNSPSS